MSIKIKKRSYSEIDLIFQEKDNLISNKFSVKINLVQEMLENLFYLIDTMNNIILEEYKRTNNKLDGPAALIPHLFEKNSHYLVAAHKLSLLGLINPSNSMLRSIFECISQIYLLHLTEKEAELIYKREVGILTDEEKTELRKKYRYMSPKMARDILYHNKKKTKLSEFYSSISTSTHPSIKGIRCDIELNYDSLDHTIYGILALGAANIIAFLEVYLDRLDENIIENSMELLDKIDKEYGSMVDIVPNNPLFSEKLKISPD